MGNIYKKIRGASALKKASALKQNGDNPNAINVFKVNSAGDYIQGSGSYDYTPGTDGTNPNPGSEEFQAAFKTARDQGLDEFEFNGKKYNTKLGTGGTDGTPDKFNYKSKYPGSTNIKTVEETTSPTTKDYNMGYYEARSAKLGAKQSDKIVNQKKRRQDKDIRRYEEGSRGFLGIGAGKGRGELSENVVAAYEHQGKVDEKRFTYNQVENPDYVEGGTEPKMIRGNQITGEKDGDQIVSESMRTGANTLKMNKFSSEVGEYTPPKGGETKTVTTEESSGGGKIAEGDIKNVKGKNYIEQDGKLFNFTTVDGKVVIGEEFIGKGPGYSTKNIAPFKMTGYGSKDKK